MPHPLLTLPRLFTLLMIAMALTARADFRDYTPLTSEQRSQLIPSSSRTVIDLTGTWQRSVNGETPQPIEIPNEAPDDTKAVYSKEFKIEANAAARRSWHLVFFGITDEVDIRINGRSIQRHPGGMAPFTFRVPDRLIRAGLNTLELEVGPTSKRTSIVLQNARHAIKPRIGIIREVMLVGTGHAWTSGIRTTQSITSNGATLAVEATITTGPLERLIASSEAAQAVPGANRGTVTVEATVLNANGVVVGRGNTVTLTLESSRNVAAQFLIPVPNVDRWTPQSPTLYSVEIRILHHGTLLDDVRSNVGFRSIRLATIDNRRRLVVNDTVMPVFAVDYIEDRPVVGASMAARHYEQDVRQMKTLGVNTVRVRSGAPHPYFIQLCDRYGLFVIIDLPANDIPEQLLLIEETTARLRNAADRITVAYDSHPSILAYNLSDGLDERSALTSEFHELLAVEIRKRSTTLLSKTVPAGLSASISEGGFDLILLRFLTPTDRARFEIAVSDAQRVVTRAAILTTFGIAISPNNNQGFSDPLSAQAQALIIRDMAKATTDAGLAGFSICSFNDYRRARPTMNVESDDAYLATFGLVDEWRQRRVSFDMVVSIINDEKEPLLQAREFADDTPLIFITTGLILALTLLLLGNRSRRFREYVIRSIVRPYNFYADIRDQRILSTLQTTLLGAVISACVGLVIASLLYFVRTSELVEYALLLVIPSNGLYTFIRSIAWNPALAVTALSVLVFIAILVVSVLLRLSALFIRNRIFFRDALTIGVWSALPLVMLLPIGVALYQALSTAALSIWVPVASLALIVWVFLRTLKATSVVFDVSSVIVNTVGFAAVLVGLGLGVWILDATTEFLAYVPHFLSVVTA